jgi:cell wall-associated NlpC family hydrolase
VKVMLERLPDSFWNVPWVGRMTPGFRPEVGLTEGANCQRYAYAVLAHFGRHVPPLRSDELWQDAESTCVVETPAPLDLLLFSSGHDPYGAHVGVYVGDEHVLHLCAEMKRPVVWTLDEFERRERYRVLIGAKRLNLRCHVPLLPRQACGEEGRTR